MRSAALCVLLLVGAATARAEDPRLQWKDSWGPMVPHKKFPRDCSLCHVAKRWDVMRSDFSFDHKKETGYALEGAHARAACLRCHNDRGPVATFAARGCSGCHVDPHKATLGLDCKRCHNQDDWALHGRQGEKLAQHARTRFPLTGMHALVECRQCHLGADQGDFRAVPLNCSSCHQRDYARAPNHAAQGIPQDCQDCHNTTLWGPGTVMKHQFVSATPCFTCHSQDFQTAPNHIAQNFPTTCQSCHKGTSTWLGALFDHTPLGPNPVCWNCHQPEYNSAKTTPASNHAANAFPQTCQNCHSFALWGPGTAMQHAFVGTNCQTCHQADFNAAASPVNHTAQGIFASACSTCHTGFSTWTGFTHSPSSCYSTGSFTSHHNATCAQCHPTATYTSYTCTACHGSSPGSTCN